MLLLLNHAGPLGGSLESNYDLRQGGFNLQNENSGTANTTNSNFNSKESVSLKKCISLNSNKTINNINNNNPSLPSPEKLDNIAYEREQNNSLIKENKK